MRITTGFKYELPFEHWESFIDATGPQSVVRWEKSSDGLGILVQGGGGVNLVTPEALTLGSQVRDLKDSTGQLVFVANGLPYPMYVNTSEPQFDPFTRIIGWRHTLRRTPPRDVEQDLQAILESSA